MNLNSFDCEVFDGDGYFAIKNSNVTEENSNKIIIECVLQGNRSKEDVEKYLTEEQGRRFCNILETQNLTKK